MCVVGVAWLRRGAAGMAGLVKRPAAPGGGLRDRREAKTTFFAENGHPQSRSTHDGNV